MRRIIKEKEPAQLTTRRNTPGATTWNTVTGPEKQAIRTALYKEQHGLCAYCMKSLGGDTAVHMIVEHFVPRSADPSQTFCWNNLLGVCTGNTPGGSSHCDRSKGPKKLSKSPARHPPDISNFYRYTNSQGKVQPTDAATQADINILNLNHATLTQNRKRRLEDLKSILRNNKMTRSLCLALLQSATQPKNGKLPEYPEVQRQYLERVRRQKNW